MTSLPGHGMRVALFATCFNDTMWPETPKAVLTVLERLGVTVEFPLEQTCCGQMFTNTGYARETLPLVERFADVFDDFDAVVAPSGSCVGSVRHQHADVARGCDRPALAERATATAGKVYELSELLVDVLGVTDVGATFPHRVTYHPTCHSLRMLRVADKPLRLLREVRGIDLVDLPEAEECCGFGGTFAMKNADTSVAMGADKAQHVRETQAEILVAGDNSCLAHIGGLLTRQRSGIQVMHLAEVLASTERDFAAENELGTTTAGATGRPTTGEGMA
ncbi:MAG: (Fe-S)-binding protein [Nocardioides sp.]|uniref:(Fe-S)-binding protein n=1 Tax=Nocardioides sp. TaxID=35761 RepID=UPI003D6C3CC2